MADTKLTDLDAISGLALEDLLYVVDDPSGTPAEKKVALSVVKQLFRATGANATQPIRLSLSSTLPYLVSDVDSTDLFVHPYRGNRCHIWNGSSSYAEVAHDSVLTLALGTLMDAKNYDVFVYDNSGSLGVDSPVAWTSDTARATDLVAKGGCLYKDAGGSVASDRLYAGTFRTVSTTETRLSGKDRFVDDYFNDIPHPLFYLETVTDTFQSANGYPTRSHLDSDFEFRIVNGWRRKPIFVDFRGLAAVLSGEFILLGWGVNSTTDFSSAGPLARLDGPVTSGLVSTWIREIPRLGFSSYKLLETGANGSSGTYIVGDWSGSDEPFSAIGGEW